MLSCIGTIRFLKNDSRDAAAPGDARYKQKHIAELHARSAIFQQRQRVLADLWPVIHTINVSLIMGLKAAGFVASILK
jgi:hypothetical protein